MSAQYESHPVITPDTLQGYIVAAQYFDSHPELFDSQTLQPVGVRVPVIHERTSYDDIPIREIGRCAANHNE